MDNELAQSLRSVIREEFVPVNERLGRTEEQLDNVSKHLGNIDQRLNRIEEDQHLIKRAVLDTNERVIKIESILENQHRIIELLSARSIEQEAQLKRIK
jgi:archaellum component FlaC